MGPNTCMDNDMHEATLMVPATAKEEVMFLVKAEQAGIFRIRNVSDAEMGPLLVIGSANILFPMFGKRCWIQWHGEGSRRSCSIR